MNQHFLEKVQPAAGFVPVSLATGANAGARFDMSKHGRCAIVVFKGSGNAAEDPTIVVQQHNAAADGTSKALDFTRIDHKVGTLTSVGEFTTVTQAADNEFTLSNLSEAAIVVIDIKAEDLDVDGGFQWISASIADVGTNAQIGCLLYLPHEPRYGGGRLNQHFCEKFQICSGFLPVNMATGANAGDVIKLKNYGRCAVLLFAAAGAEGEPPTLTLQQAQLVGGTPANLTFERVDVKQGADVTAVAAFTQASNDDQSYALAVGNTQKIVVVDVPAEDLRIGEGYDFDPGLDRRCRQHRPTRRDALHPARAAPGQGDARLRAGRLIRGA